MVVRADPGRRSEHGDIDDGQRDDTPREDDGRGVVDVVALESPDDQEEQPPDCTGRRARVNTADVLDEGCEEDPVPERGPLQGKESA